MFALCIFVETFLTYVYIYKRKIYLYKITLKSEGSILNMKGTVVATWIKTCRNLYGDEHINEAMGMVGWNKERIFSPIETIEDEQIFKVIKYIAMKEHIVEKDLWRRIGLENIKTFHNEFPSFFKTKNF